MRNFAQLNRTTYSGVKDAHYDPTTLLACVALLVVCFIVVYLASGSPGTPLG